MATDDREVDEIEILVQMIDRIMHLLHFLVFDGQSLLKSEIAEDQEIRRLLRASWEEVDAQTRVAVRIIQQRDEEIIDRLRIYGLTGSQLRLKRGILQRLTDLFSRDRRQKTLRRLLDFVNSILGSLTGAVPLFDPLKELKEALEALIGDNEG